MCVINSCKIQTFVIEKMLGRNICLRLYDQKALEFFFDEKKKIQKYPKEAAHTL